MSDKKMPPLPEEALGMYERNHTGMTYLEHFIHELLLAANELEQFQQAEEYRARFEPREDMKLAPIVIQKQGNRTIFVTISNKTGKPLSAYVLQDGAYHALGLMPTVHHPATESGFSMRYFHTLSDEEKHLLCRFIYWDIKVQRQKGFLQHIRMEKAPQLGSLPSNDVWDDASRLIRERTEGPCAGNQTAKDDMIEQN
ncbi:hypothetical protein EI42_03591 [Thermosporothrix hazakensis]|jgi:hypothetical protein|uniref:Uncharacterized protein n=2 Tax=Thermosporothrix TaxID=768650 RepID=A0A326U4D3_THEHA|nr:hypothetical protein [Thermosporothrix hazakensis]PZW27504.1 hypothetical protein EI42_03591 [Thermosporothrix hazakensis]BBH85904.1 hypothetical protein KTC_06550 [Thermosporothrix sp. COM3]GCE45670.1 hypothetical protein KTH_05390 [Thermosporothrix hazakensis]